MKLFVKLSVLLVVSSGHVLAEENSSPNTYQNSMAALTMSTPQIALTLDRKANGQALFSESTATGCAQNTDTFKNSKILGWAKDNQNISKFVTCSDNKGLNLLRFSSSSCQEAINCRKNVAQIQLNAVGSDKIMNEIIAKDYAKNQLEQNAEAMERLETLRQFAKKKYDDKMGSNCAPRYAPPKKAGKCYVSLMDDVFNDQQNKCKFGNSCYNKTDSTIMKYSDYKEQQKIAKTMFISDYNEYRINEKVKKNVDNDSDYLNEMADLVTSDAFKAASADEKANMFLSKMDSGSGDRYKDPVLAFDFDSVSEKEKLKKMLKFRQLASLYEAKDLTKDSFKSSFDSYRKKRAEFILNEGKTCSEAYDVNKICEEMTDLSLGKTIPKDSLSVEHLSSRSLKDDKDFERFKSFMGESFNESDFDMLVTAKRCLSFGLASESYSETAVMAGKPGKGLGGLVGGMAGGPSEDVVDRSREKISSYIGESQTTTSKSEAPKAVDPSSASAVDSETVSSLSNALANSQAAVASNLVTPFSQPFTPNSYSDDEEKKEVVEKKDDTSAAANSTAQINAANDAKMNDLMKRLNAAEEKVDKMKTASEEAEAAAAKQKKIDEENALIKELKSQISDLKSAKEKKDAPVVAAAQAQAPVQDQSRNQSNVNYGSAFNSGASNTPARQEAAPKSVDNYDSGRSSNSGSSSMNFGSKGGMNNAILTSSSADNKNSNAMMITAIDGMSSEKAAQTISNRIMELNGTPFYIEEGGMVKEIIAVIKDGKVLLDEKGNPIYEKIVKGKVGDKKFAKLKEKARAPAAITDAADLKRDQEEKLKRERAEYLKLKNLTNGIIKKD